MFVKNSTTMSQFTANEEQENEVAPPPPTGMQNLLAKNLLEQRTIFLWGAVMEDNARVIVEQLCYLSRADATKPIHFYINSPGGMVTAGNAIHDIMQSIPVPVYTYCLGQAASMAAILLSAGAKGHRYIYPLGEVMIHQPSMGGFRARMWEIEVHARQISKARETAAAILAANCGKTPAQIRDDFDKDYWMNAQEAVAYGIVDALIATPPASFL
jgi:ATP-dependent Clp protease, protease subunit